MSNNVNFLNIVSNFCLTFFDVSSSVHKTYRHRNDLYPYTEGF